MYRELFENRHTVMLILDPETGRIHAANPAAEKFYGRPRTELESMHITDINTLSAAEVRAEMERARNEQRTHFLLPHRLADGSIRHVEVYSGPVEIDGKQLLYSFIFDVTERAEMEQRLAEEAIRRRVLFEQAIDGICVTDLDYAVIEANGSFARMLGCSIDEVAGMRIWEWDERYPSREAIVAEWPQPPTAPTTFQTRWRRADGSLIDVEINTSPVEWAGYRGLLNVCRDITRRVAAELALKRSEQRFRLIAENVPGAVYLCRNDPDWTMEYLTPEMERITGVSNDDLLSGRGAYASLCHPDDLAQMREAIDEAIDAGTSFHLEYRVVRPDGEIRFVEEFGGLLDVEDTETAMLEGLIFDITERTTMLEELELHRAHLEALVESRTRELRSVNEELKEACESKSRFLANMSHELRTPLNSVIGFSGTLLQGLAGDLTEEQLRQVAMISRSGKHLLALVNDLLDLSKVEAGKIEPVFARFDVCELAHASCDELRHHAQEKGLALGVDSTERCPVLSDRTKVHQILLNLVDNALKFTNDGGVSVSIEHGPGTISISVHDTGCGIPADRLDEVFEAFSQLDSPDVAKPKGTGLGLALSREYARLIGGELAVRSAFGEGSTFTLTLPAEPPAPQ